MIGYIYSIEEGRDDEGYATLEVKLTISRRSNPNADDKIHIGDVEINQE